MSSKRGGERVLESRHLIALFLGVVLLCCVFFTLGYVMGKTQYVNSPVQAASLDNAPKSSLVSGAKTSANQPPASPEWDFYSDKKNTDVPLKPTHSTPSPPAIASDSEPAAAPAPLNTKPVSSKPVPDRAAPPPARFRAPRMSRNAIVLQVAALRHESDALGLADALQQKGFPAFVITPSSDNFYRVQVGPFHTQAVGDKAKQSLEREGFKAIYRR
jgi:cell division septation protein DedD